MVVRLGTNLVLEQSILGFRNIFTTIHTIVIKNVTSELAIRIVNVAFHMFNKNTLKFV